MQHCWQADAQRRPRISSVLKRLNQERGHDKANSDVDQSHLVFGDSAEDLSEVLEETQSSQDRTSVTDWNRSNRPALIRDVNSMPQEVIWNRSQSDYDMGPIVPRPNGSIRSSVISMGPPRILSPSIYDQRSDYSLPASTPKTQTRVGYPLAALIGCLRCLHQWTFLFACCDGVCCNCPR